MVVGLPITTWVHRDQVVRAGQGVQVVRAGQGVPVGQGGQGGRVTARKEAVSTGVTTERVATVRLILRVQRATSMARRTGGEAALSTRGIQGTTLGAPQGTGKDARRGTNMTASSGVTTGTGGADQEAPIMVTEGSMKSTEEKRASSHRRTLARAGRAEEEADRVEQARLEVDHHVRRAAMETNRVVAEADGAGAAVQTGEEEGAPALVPGEGPCGGAGGDRVSRARGH